MKPSTGILRIQPKEMKPSKSRNTKYSTKSNDLGDK